MRLTLYLATAMLIAAAAAKQLPSGERHLARTGFDPGYDDRTAELVEAVDAHITTERPLDTAVGAGDAVALEAPITFHSDPDSAALYDRETPVQDVAP